MTSITTVSAVRRPGSKRDDAIALRRKIAAQISSSADAKTCTPINALRARPGRASFTNSPRSVRTGSIRVACSAGIKANSAVASVAATTRNNATRQSAAGTLRLTSPRSTGVDAHHPIDRAFERQPGEQVAAGRGRHREQQVLGHQLADDAAPRGAERKADADLALARHAAREQQVGDVGATDHQDQSEREEQRCKDGDGFHRVRKRAAPGRQFDVHRAAIDGGG